MAQSIFLHSLPFVELSMTDMKTQLDAASFSRSGKELLTWSKTCCRIMGSGIAEWTDRFLQLRSEKGSSLTSSNNQT